MVKKKKDLPVIQETRVQSQGGEDPLEKGPATHSSTLAWRMLWREEPGRLQSMGLQEPDDLVPKPPSPPSTQILVSMYHSANRGTRTFRGIANCIPGSR